MRGFSIHSDDLEERSVRMLSEVMGEEEEEEEEPRRESRRRPCPTIAF